MKVSQFIGHALLSGASMESEVTVVLSSGEVLTVNRVTSSGNELVIHTDLYVGEARHISVLPRVAHRMQAGGICSCGFRGNILGHLNVLTQNENNEDIDLTF